MKNITEALAEFRENLLDNDYPLGIDEILGYIQYFFDGDRKVKSKIDTYLDDYYEMFECARKFYKVKDLIDEQFYMNEGE